MNVQKNWLWNNTVVCWGNFCLFYFAPFTLISLFTTTVIGCFENGIKYFTTMIWQKQHRGKKQQYPIIVLVIHDWEIKSYLSIKRGIMYHNGDGNHTDISIYHHASLFICIALMTFDIYLMIPRTTVRLYQAMFSGV